jgi:hypothetical protein
MSDEVEPDASPPAPSPGRAEGSLLRATPDLARIVTAAWWSSTKWTVRTTARMWARLAKAAVSRESPAEFFAETGEDVRDYLRRMLELVDTEGDPSRRGARAPAPGGDTDSLRERGAELLRRSADVRFREDSHPAYARILENLTPDEARILRLLVQRGPQPAVDVRSGLPLVGSELVSAGVSMIGAEAGCRDLDGVHAYLTNLYRLGLIWFSREPVKDRLRYQVLEAQPEVIDAMREGGRTARTVRRSIHLTRFGADFCELCLPIETQEIEALPARGESEAESAREPERTVLGEEED